MANKKDETSTEVWVMLVGARQPARPLLVSSSDMMLILLQTIEAEYPTFFAGVDGMMVRLYLAKQGDGEWTPMNSPETKALMDGHGPIVDAICHTELCLQDSIREHFNRLGRDNVHLLVRVVRPHVPLGKRTRALLKLRDKVSFMVLCSRPKAAFADDSEVEEASIYLYEAKDENSNWLSRTVSDLSTFEKIQNSTEDELRRKALQATLKLKDVFHSFCHEDLNVLVMTAPVFVVAPCSEHWHLTEHYRAVAETLEMHSGVTELVGDIERVSKMGAVNPFITPFVVLENSSGTGKTQMAFTLMAQKDVQVYYVSCGESQSGARHVFMRRSKSFLRCIEEDLPKVDDARMFFVFPQLQLHTFGFICALLTGRSSFIEPKGSESVRKELKARSRGRRNCVIFLDEFPRVNNEHPMTSEPAIRLMLNVFRAFGLAVILSTTSATARDLATMDAGRYLQQSGGLWCVVRPSLPPFECSSREALPCDLQKIGDNSRPSFAAFAAEYTTEHALGHDVVEYTDRMAAALADTIDHRERFSSEAFRVGQTCIFLGASYGDDDLVDNSAKFDDAGRLISDHFSRLRERKAFELILGNENNPSKFADGKVP
ncbi:hypothetical protein PRNP1_005436 [Phytophthora ramorum]